MVKQSCIVNMKIAQVHNFYQQPGGEDTVVSSEKQLLEQNGHTVIPYYQYNTEIDDFSRLEKLKLFGQLHFSTQSYAQCVQFLEEHEPDVCHVHNTLHLISPAIFEACKTTNTPVVHTLHNYRSICANGMLTRNKKPCEDCLGQSAYKAVKNKCYRDSLLQTLALARMIEKNKSNRLLQEGIDAFICFTDFAKEKFITHGIPKDKIHLKPNFVGSPTEGILPQEDYLIFVGRLEEAKGAHLLVDIAKKNKLPVYVIGDGPLKKVLENRANIRLKGKQPNPTTLKYIQGAKALLLPSLVYEGMPMALLEAFAHHTPVIASNLGAMAAMIKHNHTGLLFEPNNDEDILDKINTLLNNQLLANQIAKNGFEAYQKKYNAQTNYQTLKTIYESVLKT